MNHTPGPWMLIETPHENILSDWSVKVGEHQIPMHPYKRIWSEDRTQSGLIVDDQHMADAQLIAAAPDLLEALKTILEMPDYDGSITVSTLRRAAKHAAKAAIAKATGGAA